MNPEFEESWASLGTLQRKMNNFEESARSYTKATELKPNRPEILYNLASAYLDLGKLGMAKIYFEKVIELKSKYADAHSSLGTVYLRMNQPI